jgi:hypothetical protein
MKKTHQKQKEWNKLVLHCLLEQQDCTHMISPFDCLLLFTVEKEALDDILQEHCAATNVPVALKALFKYRKTSFKCLKQTDTFQFLAMS